MEPLLSIIIPHRNIPHLLRRCLKSIPEREDIQIIVVDDCSDESIKEIIATASNSNRIETYSTSTPKGGGAARNVGLTHTKGKWVTFIDADDFFTEKFNDIVNSLAAREEIDILYCSANSVDSEYYTSSKRADTLNKYISLYQKKDLEGENRLRFTFGEPWCKIVKRTLIENNDITFTESSIHNDTHYSYLVGYYAKNIAVTPYALCTITTRDGSVSKTLSESKKLERIMIFAEAHRFYKNHNIPSKYVINFLWPQMARSFFENKETYKKGYRILREHGFSSFKIGLNTLKHIVRNKLVKESKKMMDRIG